MARVRRSGMDAFAEPHRIARLLRGFKGPWFVAGGWAIDLFVGRETRAHEDIEIAVWRDDQRTLRQYLTGWRFEKIARGTREPWREDEWLALPVHEVHGVGPDGESLEILLNERTGGAWQFRRNPTVTRPEDRIALRSRDGIPFLAPEVVLLYKAKDPRPHDEQDFTTAQPRLDPERAEWLRRALELCHPGHPWTAPLGTPATS